MIFNIYGDGILNYIIKDKLSCCNRFYIFIKLAIDYNLPKDEKFFTNTLKIYFSLNYDIIMLISGKDKN